VINMSFNFGCGKDVPGVDQELRRAYRMGVVTVASIGNLGSETCISPPATGPRTIGVGGTTEGGCLGAYSLLPGKGLDVLAPGGGTPEVSCPSVSSRSIYQVTLKGGNPRRFGEPGNYIGTSMAAAHVSGSRRWSWPAACCTHRAGLAQRRSTVTSAARAPPATSASPASRQGAGLIDAGAADRSRLP
jgi:hypothetical protein